MKIKPLAVIDGETLMDTRLPRRSFCIETLLPEGISMLGGAPKIGKSWMVLAIGIHVAKGIPIWNLPTKKGTVLYLALEDSLSRIQDRLNRLCDDVPSTLYFATAAGNLAGELRSQISNFIEDHPDTVLVIIDTFQIVRSNRIDTSYANDYEEVRKLKALADEHRISLLLVHHLRKQTDSDPLNKLSGTTGISGAMDAVFILESSRQRNAEATLRCFGRDIENRKIRLRLSQETCDWTLVDDSLKHPEILLPTPMQKLISFLQEIKKYKGGNTEFAEDFNRFSGEEISAKALKQMMNRWRYSLEENGVFFESNRSNGQRFIKVEYRPLSAVEGDESVVKDGKITLP